MKSLICAAARAQVATATHSDSAFSALGTGIGDAVRLIATVVGCLPLLLRPACWSLWPTHSRVPSLVVAGDRPVICAPWPAVNMRQECRTLIDLVPREEARVTPEPLTSVGTAGFDPVTLCPPGMRH